MTAKNEFMSALYGAIGSEVSGFHRETPFHGTITYTRVKYGNDISVHVEDESDIYVIDGTALLNGEGGGYSNLHVYFN
jgi:hypothetical protein